MGDEVITSFSLEGASQYAWQGVGSCCFCHRNTLYGKGLPDCQGDEILCTLSSSSCVYLV